MKIVKKIYEFRIHKKTFTLTALQLSKVFNIQHSLAMSTKEKHANV